MQRIIELNEADMMQSMYIHENIDSVIEFKIVSLMAVSILTIYTSEAHSEFTLEGDKNSQQIMLMLIIQNVFSYLSEIFRDWDLAHHGYFDDQGVYRGRNETILQILQIFIACVITGYSMKHMQILTAEEFYDEAFISYWIIIDCILTLLNLVFVYVSNQLTKDDERIKNLYTIFTCQKLKLSGIFAKEKKQQQAIKVEANQYWSSAGGALKKTKSIRGAVFHEDNDISNSDSSDSETSDEDGIRQIRELDYLLNERVQFSDDVYNLTIANNMTKAWPYLTIFALQQCFIVFILQQATLYYFIYERLNFDNYQDYQIS